MTADPTRRLLELDVLGAGEHTQQIGRAHV